MSKVYVKVGVGHYEPRGDTAENIAEAIDREERFPMLPLQIGGFKVSHPTDKITIRRTTPYTNHRAYKRVSRIVNPKRTISTKKTSKPAEKQNKK